MKKVKLYLLMLFIILIASFQGINASSKRDLPYEVNEIKINSAKETLEINGWAFITDAQNYLSDATHQYKLYLDAGDDKIEVVGQNLSISHTDTMHYVGSRPCGSFEFNKLATVCNNYYENIGFRFEIPLDQLKLNKSYKASLEVWAKMAKVKKTIPIFYPVKEKLVLRKGQKQVTVDSKLNDVKLEVLFNHVVVRDKAGKTGKILQSKTPCSTPNNLYYKKGTTFSKVFDKESLNNTTYYKLAGMEDLCINGYALTKEGSDLFPIWIASNFVGYRGKQLSINTSFYNMPPLITVKNHPTIYVNEKIDFMEGVTAYDYEDGDLTSEIIIISNNFENKPGLYSVGYSVTDKDNETTTAKKNIQVLAKNFPPIIRAYDIEVKQFSYYNPYANVSAIDQDGLNITSKLITTTTVDTAVAEPQLQCYTVTDDYNLTTNKCIVVNVLAPESIFRFIDKDNIFYHENIPLIWVNKLDRLYLEVSNQITYIKRTISL